MLIMSFAQGAIIRFGFNCQTSGVESYGKVVRVTEKEIVLIPQIMIELPRGDGTYPFAKGDQIIDCSRSVDSDRKVHIDRAIIASWEYGRINTKPIYFNAYKTTEVVPEDVIVNHYKDGYCIGNGNFFEE